MSRVRTLATPERIHCRNVRRDGRGGTRKKLDECNTRFVISYAVQQESGLWVRFTLMRGNESVFV